MKMYKKIECKNIQKREQKSTEKFSIAKLSNRLTVDSVSLDSISYWIGYLLNRLFVDSVICWFDYLLIQLFVNSIICLEEISNW